MVTGEMCAASRPSSSSSSFASTHSPPPPQGTKRRGDDAVNSEQRLSKRFHLLNLGDKSKESLWIPPSSTAHASLDSEIANRQSEADTSCSMQIDDAKDRIYIRNLDDELESPTDLPDQESIIFLPDIERTLNKIPKHILQRDDRPRVTGTEMVLYRIPSSLSVPVEQDSVRRAILESRARARERVSRDALLRDHRDNPEQYCHHERQSSSLDNPKADEDAMDIG